MAIRPDGVDLHRAQHRAKQLQPAHVVAVVDVPRDQHRVDAGLEQLPADVEGPRRDARVVKRAGVGEDRQVDVRGDLDARAARRAPSIRSNTISPQAAADASNQLICAVAGVAGMMVDVDHEEALEPGHAGSRAGRRTP